MYTIPTVEKKRRNNIVKGLLTGRRRFVPFSFVRAHEIRSLYTVHNEQSVCVSVCVVPQPFPQRFSTIDNTTKSRPLKFSKEKIPYIFFSNVPPFLFLLCVSKNMGNNQKNFCPA